MVNPDVDNAILSAKNNSTVSHIHIPASCQKHTAKSSRTVDINYLLSYVNISLIGKPSSFMAKTNTWCYSWLILLGLCVNTSCIISCCQSNWTKKISCHSYICFINSHNTYTSFLETSSIFCYPTTSFGWCSSGMKTIHT